MSTLFEPILPDRLKEQIRHHALQYPDEEVCGLVVNGEAIPLENIAPNRSENFACAIEIADYDAIYHSHIRDTQPGELTFDDIEQCKIHEKPYILHNAATNVWDYFDPSSPNPFPLRLHGDEQSLEFYLNWRFIWGRSDCFAVIRCYFFGVYAIDIGDFKRPNRIQQKAFPQPDWVAPWVAEEHGFTRLPAGESPKVGDIIEIAQRGGKNSNHLAAIVDTDNNEILMLHSPHIRELSRLEVYGEYWQQRTTKHCRHQLLQK